jgi:hypothetical protein
MKYLFLLLPCAVALAAPWYNSVEPRLAGIPFFFWFQMVMIPASALGILLAYLGEKR